MQAAQVSEAKLETIQEVQEHPIDPDATIQMDPQNVTSNQQAQANNHPLQQSNGGKKPTTLPANDGEFPQPVSNTTGNTLASHVNSPQQIIQPLLNPAVDTKQETNTINAMSNTTTDNKQPEQQLSQQATPQKTVVTKVTLRDELNIFDWFKTADIINHIAEKAKSSVDSVITVLDPGMKEYLYSGGNINIIVISDSNSLISPIRDAFQSVFGRATVVAARYTPPEAADEYPVKLAYGFDEAIVVAQERIRKLRLDTSNVPQNQVVVAIQPSIVSVTNNETAGNRVTNGLKFDENLSPKWFLTYCMLIEDPVLGSTMNSYSQFIPIDTEIITTAKEAKFPDNFSDTNLGFAKSITELMYSKLKLATNESEDDTNRWITIWSGLNETEIINNLSISLAHLYRRKWNDCMS